MDRLIDPQGMPGGRSDLSIMAMSETNAQQSMFMNSCTNRQSGMKTEAGPNGRESVSEREHRR